MRLERSVVIHRPLPEVFALAANPQHDLQWGSLIVDSQQLSAGPISRGAMFDQTLEFMGARITATLEITEYEPNRRVCYAISRPLTLEHCRRFESIPEGTELTFIVDADAGNRFRAAGSMLTRVAARQMEDDLDALKDLLEANRPVGP